jgi:hypothetical protein
MRRSTLSGWAGIALVFAIAPQSLWVGSLHHHVDGATEIVHDHGYLGPHDHDDDHDGDTQEHHPGREHRHGHSVFVAVPAAVAMVVSAPAVELGQAVVGVAQDFQNSIPRATLAPRAGGPRAPPA